MNKESPESDQRKSNTWLAEVWHYFSRRDVPLWVTLLLAVSGAFATNAILPSINQRHEYAKMKSAFVLQSLSDLNEQTSLLVALLTETNDEFRNSGSVSVETRIRASRTISALQWEASEISMFLSNDNTQALEDYKLKLNDVRRCLGVQGGDFDKSCADEATLEFLQAAENLGKDLTQLR